MLRLREMLNTQKTPAFGMRTKKLNKESLGNGNDKDYSFRLASQLIVYYQHILLKSTLEALGGKVIAIPDLPDSTKKSNFSFVRDPVVVLPDQNLMLSTQG